MNTNVTVRSELKKIASQIETLAHEAHTKLSNGSSILDVANELVKNSITLTFGLGELYATENTARVASTTVTNKTKTGSRNVSANWHNVRDNRGRFTRVTRP